MEEFDKAVCDWDEVAEIIPNVHVSNLSQAKTEDHGPLETPLVKVEEVLENFRSRYFDLLISNEDEAFPLREKRQNRFSQLRRIISCPSSLFFPPLRGNLEVERSEVLSMARCAFDDSNPIHFEVLLTIFKQLTRSRFDCPRYGGHWEDIGFQGNDPSTDLRGVGFLGLLQALYFLMTPELVPLARNIFKLSQHETQNFPFMVLSINITRITLLTLRENILNSHCVRENSVWSATNFFYVAIMYHIYKIWKEENKTIRDSGFMLKSAEQLSKTKPKQLLANLNAHIVSGYTVQEKQSERQNIIQRSKK